MTPFNFNNLDPGPKEKLQACGKKTLLVTYEVWRDSGPDEMVEIMVYRCHVWIVRYAHKSELRLLKIECCKSTKWYAQEVPAINYGAMKKRIERAGAIYCALGTGDNWLFLTDKPIGEDGRLEAIREGLSCQGRKLKNLLPA